MDKLGSLISGSLKKGGADRTVRAAVIATAIEKAVAGVVPGAAGHFRVASIRDGIARLRCTSSVTAEEIRINAAEIIAAANSTAGKDVVRRIIATS